MIRFSNIHKSFSANHVLKGIDLEFQEQGIVAILGPNGSGKTTLLKCLLGMCLFDSGCISYNGIDISKDYMYRQGISHLPQICSFPSNLTISELIAMVKDLRHSNTREDYLIDLFDLGPELHKKTSMLSGGNKQKLNLLLCFMFDNPVLVLDEPTSGLDPLAIINLKNFLLEEKKRGKLILVTTHIISFVEAIAERIVFLMDGKVYFDGPIKNLLSQQKAKDLELAIANILKAEIEINHLKKVLA